MRKSDLSVRWLVLVLACCLMIGNYYVYDNFSALKTQIEDRMGEDNYESYFALAYSVYSIPNTVLPFLGGVMIDRLGSRLMVCLFAGLILAGQTIVWLGISNKSWAIVLLGRTVFGFGGESLTVGQSTIVAEWFGGAELALALGINLSIARLGSVINNVLSPYWAKHQSVSFAFFFGVLVCGMSLACTLLLVPIDKAVELKIKKKKAALLLNEGGGDDEDNSGADEEEIHLSDVKHFRKGFWLLALSCLTVYGCVLPFNNVANAELMKRYYFTDDDCDLSQWDEDPYCIAKRADEDPSCDDSEYKHTQYCEDESDGEAKAGEMQSIVFIISAVSSPFLGAVVDRYGHRANTAVAAPIMFLAVHLWLGLTYWEPAVALVLLGIAYSIFAAALWPSVPYVVEPQHVGTAYGVITAIQNIGLAIFPLIVGAIIDADETYEAAELFFAFLAVCGLFAGLALVADDKKNGNVLNLPSASTSGGQEDDDDVPEMPIKPAGYEPVAGAEA